MPKKNLVISYDFRRCRLQQLRLAKNIPSQRALVKAIKAAGYEVSHPVIQRMEKGEIRNVGWDAVYALSEFFGVSADYLMGRDNYVSTPNKTISDEEEIPLELKTLIGRYLKEQKLKEIELKKKEG